MVDGAPPLFRVHRCDPARVPEHELRREWLGDNHLDPQAAHWIANAVACPKCGVSAGQPCENLERRKRGGKVLTMWPHSQRLADADQENGRAG